MIFSFMAIPKRYASVITLIGEKKTGKTTLTEEMIDKMLKYQSKGAIIFDVGNQYHQFPKISVSEIKNWGLNINQFKTKNPVVRVVIDRDKLSSRQKELAAFANFCNPINAYVSNSLVVFEDLLAFIRDRVPLCLSAVLFKNRPVSNDILLNVHSFDETPPEIFRRTEIFYCKYTKDQTLKPKVLYLQEFNAIRKVLARENTQILTLPDNEFKVQYATVEFIADISLQEQLEALPKKIVFNNF
jgi:hypothetical protein